MQANKDTTTVDKPAQGRVGQAHHSKFDKLRDCRK